MSMIAMMKPKVIINSFMVFIGLFLGSSAFAGSPPQAPQCELTGGYGQMGSEAMVWLTCTCKNGQILNLDIYNNNLPQILADGYSQNSAVYQITTPPVLCYDKADSN